MHEELVPPELLSAAQRSWDEAVEVAEMQGVRNSQATVLAPTGTIGLMMDCDTTGIEPDLALTKAKKLVGGGTMMIVNQTIPRALRKLGYSEEQGDAIVQHINEHKTLVGAPGFNPEHLPVFACSMGDNTIHHDGHLQMMAAVQPFLSGAISKTVNLPNEVGVNDIMQVYLEGWKLGLKAVAVYRDGSKRTQPLTTNRADCSSEPVEDRMTKEAIEAAKRAPFRRRMPSTRQSIPSPALEKIRFPRILKSPRYSNRIPAFPLWAMVFPALGDPITAPTSCSTPPEPSGSAPKIPWVPFPRGVTPSAPTPIKLPRT